MSYAGNCTHWVNPKCKWIGKGGQKSMQSLHVPTVKLNFKHRQWDCIQDFKLGSNLISAASKINLLVSGAVVSDGGRVH